MRTVLLSVTAILKAYNDSNLGLGLPRELAVEESIERLLNLDDIDLELRLLPDRNLN